MDDFYGNNNGNGYNNGGYNNGGYNNNGYGSGYNNNGYGSNGYNSNGYNNNGYGSSGYNNGGYNNGQNFGYNSDYEPEQRGGAGLAIASFVLSLVNLLLCCTLLSIITVPLCLIFSIISLVKKRKGTAFAIIGLIIALISGALFAYRGVMVYRFFSDGVWSDFVYFAENEEQIIEDYERDGTIPDRYDKYRSPKYDKIWKDSGFEDFDDFFDQFIKQRKAEGNGSGSYSTGKSSTDLALGFQPALLV
jgi:hypothetical protein